MRSDILQNHRMLIMGILNITPDSFYDGGQHDVLSQAIDHARHLIDAGADIIDIGGESTRPGSLQVDVQTELDRVIPVVKALRAFSDIPVSVDTTKSVVARAAIEAGATIINDISAGLFDPEILQVAKQFDVPIILMHMQGEPATMQQAPEYAAWVVDEICDFFTERIAVAESQGIGRDRIILDPGIGFGKTFEHNLDIIANAHLFRKFGVPVLLGHSNKRFIGEVLESQSMNDRIWGTGAVVAFVQLYGAFDIVRVHNVKEIKIITTMIEALQQRIQ